MKILQVSDCHLVPRGDRLFSLDPAERLARAIEDINLSHSDAELCVLTGDLAHHGDAGAYRVLRDLVCELTIPYQLVPGNHDDRAALLAAFPDTHVDPDGFVQSVVAGSDGPLMFLDTIDPGVHSGAYCETRGRWLEQALSNAGDRPVFVFMHHPLMPIGMPRLDQYRITDPQVLSQILQRHPSVRHMFFGHVHRPVSGSWKGIPFSSVPGTNHQNALDFGDARENISSLEPPAYAVILADADSTVVHIHQYADANPRYRYDPDAPGDEQIQLLEAP